MPRPKITRDEIARIVRPATRNSSGAEIAVAVCTLEPHGAPASVRPRYVEIDVTRPDGGGVTLAIRRAELPALLDALTKAAERL